MHTSKGCLQDCCTKLENLVRKLHLILPILWALLIFFLSHQPAEVSSGQSGVLVSQLQTIAPGADVALLTFIVRKGAHVVAYFILGILVYNALRRTRLPWQQPGVGVVAGTVCLLYACSDELHQTFVPGRSGEVRDVLLDSTAAVVGIILAAYSIKLLQKSKK